MKDFIMSELSKRSARDPNAFISKTDDLKEGINLYVGSTKFAYQIAKEAKKIFDADVSITKKQAGMKDGIELKRTTVLFRLKDKDE